MTVDEHLQFAWLQSNKKSQWPVARIYRLFPELKQRSNVSGTQLSGGEQKMMAISQAPIANPVLLMLDEPSEGLSIFIIQRIEEMCRQLNSQGIAILLVEQNANLALQAASRGYVVETGEITLEDEAQKLLSNPKIREAYLGE